MARKGNVLIIILVILVLMAFSIGGGVFYLFQKERAKNIELSLRVDDLNAKQKVTESKLHESEKSVSDLEGRLQESRSKIDDLDGQLRQEKTAKQEALAQIEIIKTDLQQQKGLRLDLESKLAVAQGDFEKAKTQLSDLESQKAQLTAKVNDLEIKAQRVELGKIVVNSEPIVATPVSESQSEAIKTKDKAKSKKEKSKPVVAAKPAVEKKQSKAQAPLLEGIVSVVNKDYSFLVINLGSKDGVQPGQLFAVYHLNKYVGDVKVEKVHEAMSAAGFVAVDIKDKVSEGDRVLQKVR